ncbi:MAG: hypothetical protein R6X06_10800 [Gammaproteobacteria bacterium]
MALSPLSSTSYHRPVSPTADGQAQRDGQSARAFDLQRSAQPGDEPVEVTLMPRVGDPARQSSPDQVEKWLRLMGAARQMAYQDEQRAGSGAPRSDDMRYRLQRTYFDQELQSRPSPTGAPDPRLQAYRAAEAQDNRARIIDSLA